MPHPATMDTQKMLSNEVRRISAGLGALAGTVTEEVWSTIKQTRGNLDALALQIEVFEASQDVAIDKDKIKITLKDDNCHE